MENLREKIIRIVTGMGRDRSLSLTLIDSLQETIEEHLWKIFVYHEYSEQDLRGWSQSLNKHIPKLNKFRIPKKGGKPNFGYKELYDKFYVEPFGTDADIGSLIKSWSTFHNYPVIKIEDKNKLEKFVVKYINCILDNKKFEFTSEELNENI